jgi:hypothetical protein
MRCDYVNVGDYDIVVNVLPRLGPGPGGILIPNAVAE